MKIKLKSLSSKTVFVFKEHRSLANLINRIIDTYCSKRIALKAVHYNNALQGKMVIFAHDYIGIHVNQYGFFEKSALDMIFTFLEPILNDLLEGVALDIGANIGNHSLYFSSYFVSVIAFEPHPLIYEILRINSMIVSNIITSNIGLGEKKECLELNENLNNMGSASIKHSWTVETRKVKVDIDRLDDINLEAQKISFMKIDVEGLEASVIRGALKTIRRHQPLILLEQLLSEFVNGTTESIQLLQDEGYLFCWSQPWATSRGLIERRINSVRNIFFGGTYDYNFITGSMPPPGTYEMLIAIPKCFHRQLLHGR